MTGNMGIRPSIQYRNVNKYVAEKLCLKVKKEVIEDSPVKPSIFATPEKSLHRIKVPPSPQMRPNKPNEKEKQLIEWANKTLSNQEPPIKITNLFTSWQNGLGFCALIRKYFSKTF